MEEKEIKEMKNMTRHMYQDGNDLVIVYTNVFNNNYKLEDMMREEILKPTFIVKGTGITDITPYIEPLETPDIPQPKIIHFGFIPTDKFNEYIRLGGLSKRKNNTTINYVTSEETAQIIEKQLGVKRKA